MFRVVSTKSQILYRTIGLRQACVGQASRLSSVQRFDHKSHQNLIRYAKLLKDKNHDHIAPVEVECQQSDLYKALHSLWYTVCAKGNLDKAFKDLKNSHILKDITVTKMDSAKLLEAVMFLNQGKNSSEFKMVEIDTSWLCPYVLKDVAESCDCAHLFGRHISEIKAVKCVLQTAESTSVLSGVVLDHNTNPTFVGALVVFLDSEFTGGELEVVSDGHATVVTGARSWVVMRKECQYKFHPVTSGTRVCLVYDVFDKHIVRRTQLENTIFDGDSVRDYFNTEYSDTVYSDADSDSGEETGQDDHSGSVPPRLRPAHRSRSTVPHSLRYGVCDVEAWVV